MGKRIITKDKGINKDKRIIKGIAKGTNRKHLNKKIKKHQFNDNFPEQLPSKSLLGWAKKNIRGLYMALKPKNREAIRKDQAVRAKTIVKYMQQNSLSDIVLLDSVGRMTSQIIIELHKAHILRNTNITLIEKEKTTHEYHKQYLPSDIQKINGDIMTYRFSNNTMVYLNFCSIGSIVDEIGESEFIAYLEKIRHVMIGFSVQGTNKGKSIRGEEKKKTKLSIVLKYIKPPKYAFVSKRGGFYETYISRN